MAQQIINIGTVANDGNGDPLRTSFHKTNQNFTEVYSELSNKIGFTTGSWQPEFICETPGDLDIAYTVQSGNYTQLGNIIIASFTLVTSTFTHSTASGSIAITGFPVSSADTSAGRWTCPLAYQGIGASDHVYVFGYMEEDSTTMLIKQAGPGESIEDIDITDLPSAGAVIFSGTLTYMIES